MVVCESFFQVKIEFSIGFTIQLNSHNYFFEMTELQLFLSKPFPSKRGLFPFKHTVVMYTTTAVVGANALICTQVEAILSTSTFHLVKYQPVQKERKYPAQYCNQMPPPPNFAILE